MAGPLPHPGQLTLRNIRAAPSSIIIDKGLVVWNPRPKSFTGEDVCEFHLHGGRAVLRLLIDSLSKLGLREARPGEFTRRAFENGKLDLSEVEGVADLIGAETEAQRRQALRHSTGMLREAAEGWRARLISLRAQIEAQLDFADEGDVDPGLSQQFFLDLDALRAELAKAATGFAAGEMVREGFRVAIVGRPNAGKSSLLNALARRDVAIVTDEPGTTRDVLEVMLDVDGHAIRLFDTAGIRDALSSAELEGIRRTHETARAADMVLMLSDGSDPMGPALWDDGPTAAAVIMVTSKADLLDAKPEAGIPELLQVISGAVLAAGGTEPALLTRVRQQEAVSQALQCLDSSKDAAPEVCAHLLRSAGDAIGRLSGQVDIEDVLDHLFAEFCIGK
jgi:tRNA modification GTPase